MIASYQRIEGQARQDLRNLGLPAPVRPGDFLHIMDDETGEVSKWPGDKLGHIHDHEISAWLGVLAAWKAYAKAEVGIADAITVTAKAELARIRAPLVLAAEGRTLTEKRAVVDARPEVAALIAIIEQASAKRVLIKSIAEGFDDKYLAVSRDLTRRAEQRERTGPLGQHHQRRAARGI